MEIKSNFPSLSIVDRIFAWVYPTVGYGFIQITFSFYMNGTVSLYTVFYAAVVLTYLFLKNLRPAKESWFWLVVMLALGISYDRWTILYFAQILALIVVAAYWTLSTTGRLLDHGKTSHLIFFDLCNSLIIIPLSNFSCLLKVMFVRTTKKDESKKTILCSILIGILLTLPMLAIVIPLLSGADAGFEKVAGNLVTVIEGISDYLSRHFLLIFIKILFSLPISFYLFGLVFGGITERKTDIIQPKNIALVSHKIKIIPERAVCTSLVILCLLYMIFILLQGHYLFFAFTGKLPTDFTYSEYARRGFFELCQVGFCNLIFLLLSEIFVSTTSSNNKMHRFMSALISGLTLLILTTAGSKLILYMATYGLTAKRVISMVFLIWLAVVFSAIIVRQYKNFTLVRFCVMIGAIFFCTLCVFPIEKWTLLFNSWEKARGLIL